MKKLIPFIVFAIVILFYPNASDATYVINSLPGQRGWQDGQSTELVSYKNLGNWHKYSEINNVNISMGQAFPEVLGPDTYLISTPIDFENLEVKMGWDVSSGVALLFRNADSVGALTGSPWFVASPSQVTNKRYVQYKLAFDDSGLPSEGVDIALSSIYYKGSITGSVGEAIQDWQVCWSDYRCAIPGPMTGQDQYALNVPFFRGEGFTRTYTASAPGYSPTTVTVTAANYLTGTAGHYYYYYGSQNIVLNKINTGSVTPTTTSIGQTNNITTTVKPVEKFGGTGAPVVPLLSDLKISDKQYQNTEEFKYEFGEPVLFSGKTIPNGIVRLYFHSEPFEDTTTANTEGVWTYELIRDIGIGDHELQIAVTNPTTNLTSEKSEAVKFTLIAPEFTETQPLNINNKSKNNYFWYYLGTGIFFITLVGTGGFIWWKKSKKTRLKKL